MEKNTLPWIDRAAGTPYFATEQGDAWTPIGQNDAITWPDLAGAFRRRDLAGVEDYFGRLQQAGVTTLRLMLEHPTEGAVRLDQPVAPFAQRRFGPRFVQSATLERRHAPDPTHA